MPSIPQGGASAQEVYGLPRDYTESARLNLQHEVYKRNVGYLLHPRIVARLPENPHIADVGTGTGIWLRDIASQSPPSWKFTGLDISSAQFPQQNGESNVSYGVLNILNDVPAEHKAKYDVVHLCLLNVGLIGSDWQTTAQHVVQLLKPGGWIQWHECDYGGMQVLQTVSEASVDECTRLIDLARAGQQAHGKLISSNIKSLLNTVQNAGFENTSQDLFSSDRVLQVRKEMNDVTAAAWVGILKKAVQQDTSSTWTVEDVESLAQRCRVEMEDEKVYMRFDFHVITGRRPG